ncbi:urease accessory protein UreE [Spirulina sp. CS-785/01]|uniref:urease accessory protein UreE n=1 Tax=Spirulina sp. CS-785/01 TaxID=3021716 RepID=UPI00232E4D2E|nr:urease accessory protein UreE [Spirulina sp. CS-785/01]MDB9312540.1 urease accessory protein UreE [Spirulina sp. CS-785/01]
MLLLVERVGKLGGSPSSQLPLTAEERTRSRHRFETGTGEVFVLALPRGTVVQDGECLRSQTGEIVQIIAKPEPVLTVTSDHPLTLLKAAYHLGNRHIPLEITPTYLRLSPDRVLQQMLEKLGLTIQSEIAPFYPEIGAYGQSHHSH